MEAGDRLLFPFSFSPSFSFTSGEVWLFVPAPRLADARRVREERRGTGQAHFAGELGSHRWGYFALTGFGEFFLGISI